MVVADGAVCSQKVMLEEVVPRSEGAADGLVVGVPPVILQGAEYVRCVEAIDPALASASPVKPASIRALFGSDVTDGTTGQIQIVTIARSSLCDSRKECSGQSTVL